MVLGRVSYAFVRKRVLSSLHCNELMQLIYSQPELSIAQSASHELCSLPRME